MNTRTNSKCPSGCPSCAGRAVTPTNNLAVWCGKNGREDLLGEWAHPDKAPKEFTPASTVKVPWQCGECGRGWGSTINSRTKSSRPSGCPGCAGQVVTPTNNLAVWCGKNGRADLLGEWAHPDKAPTDFTRASNAKMPWQCGECGLGWDAVISKRTSSKPTRCPSCNSWGRPSGKVEQRDSATA